MILTDKAVEKFYYSVDKSYTYLLPNDFQCDFLPRLSIKHTIISSQVWTWSNIILNNFDNHLQGVPG